MYTHTYFVNDNENDFANDNKILHVKIVCYGLFFLND